MSSMTNTKAIARALSALFQLSDEDRAFVFRVWRMDDTERELLVETLSPQKSSSKKPASKSAGKGAKSKRASGMAAAIRDSLKRGQQVASMGNDDNEDDGRCIYKLGEGAAGPVICDTTLDNNVHHKKTDPDYHEFDAGKSSASTAERSSSANGAGASGTASSGMETAAAGSAAHVQSGSADGKAQA